MFSVYLNLYNDASCVFNVSPEFFFTIGINTHSRVSA